MIQSICITLIILFCNTLFFFYGGAELIQTLWGGTQIRNSVYKIIAYAGPMISMIYLVDNSTLHKQFQKKFQWFKEKRVYAIWLFRAGVLFIGKSLGSVHFGIQSLFHVLVVNSIVEESVFRGYIQDKLVKKYGAIGGIVGQAILFGLVHIPFYITHYQAGLYDQMNNLIGGIVPIESLGPFIVIFAIGSPIALGLVRGWIMHKTKSLRPSIIWHSIHNGILLFI